MRQCIQLNVAMKNKQVKVAPCIYLKFLVFKKYESLSFIIPLQYSFQYFIILPWLSIVYINIYWFMINYNNKIKNRVFLLEKSKQLFATVFKIPILDHENSAQVTQNCSDLYKSFLKLYYKCIEPH